MNFKTIGIVISREYLNKVKKKSFIWTTLLVPILVAGLTIGVMVALMNTKEKTKTIAVVDGKPVYGKETRTATKPMNALVVLDTVDSAVIRSCNNIPTAKTTQFSTLNVYDVLNAEKLVLTVEAVKKLEEVYAK